MHPAGIVNAQDIVIGNGLRLGEIGRLSEVFFEQPIVNQPILARGEHMVAEVEIVARMIHQLKREHPSRFGGAAVLLYGYIVLLVLFPRIGGRRNHPAWRQNRDKLFRRARARL